MDKVTDTDTDTDTETRDRHKDTKKTFQKKITPTFGTLRELFLHGIQ